MKGNWGQKTWSAPGFPDRDWVTAMVSAFSERSGADIVRVHKVGVTVMALHLKKALEERQSE